MADLFKINDVEVAALGIIVLDEVYDDLIKFPEVKDTLVNDWADEHGKERDVVNRKFKSRNINIKLLLKGADRFDYLAKKKALINTLAAGYFNFKAYGINRQFDLIYVGATNEKDYGTSGEVTLIVEDDFPHLDTPII